MIWTFFARVSQKYGVETPRLLVCRTHHIRATPCRQGLQIRERKLKTLLKYINMYRMALYLRPNIFASKILSSYIGTKIESGTVEYRATVQTRASGKTSGRLQVPRNCPARNRPEQRVTPSVRSPATTSLRADGPVRRADRTRPRTNRVQSVTRSIASSIARST